ncbi:hypothetical protein [Micromonospora sp. RV43]|uniref:hypothetical protein n=1 Tax=Micromonospora sp. RV43 TaxID=1661387 RepID=UPI00064BFF88|nr:hypothetical protein [Micromonospora sp. RV43]
MPKATTDYGVWTRKHPESGEEQRRTAHSPADAVRLKFDGWVQEAPTNAKSSTSTTASKPASSSN